MSRPRSAFRRVCVMCVMLLPAACGEREPRGSTGHGGEGAKPEAPEPGTPEAPEAPEAASAGKPAEEAGLPEHVVYDQILIAFKGSYLVKDPDTKKEELRSDTDRPREAAKELAAKVFDLARSGGDFTALKDAYTDDRGKEGEPGGLVHAALDGVFRDTREIYRSTLYPGPRAVVFNLKKDEVGMIEYDPKRCPHGWLIVKRLR